MQRREERVRETRLRIAEELPLSMEMVDELISLYATPKRYYHTIDHVVDVLEQYRLVHQNQLWEHPKEVYLAVLYHDSIYEYGAKDNEERSAQVARRCIERYFPDLAINIDYVERLIELTAIHGTLNQCDVTLEEALFLDCDMAIMGSSWERFEQYQQQIEEEYTKVGLTAIH